MFYRNYVEKIDSKNRRLYNDFLDSSKSSEEFWKTIPDITCIEKYWYEVCLKLISLEDSIIFWR